MQPLYFIAGHGLPLLVLATGAVLASKRRDSHPSLARSVLRLAVGMAALRLGASLFWMAASPLWSNPMLPLAYLIAIVQHVVDVGLIAALAWVAVRDRQASP